MGGNWVGEGRVGVWAACVREEEPCFRVRLLAHFSSWPLPPILLSRFLSNSISPLPPPSLFTNPFPFSLFLSFSLLLLSLSPLPLHVRSGFERLVGVESLAGPSYRRCPFSLQVLLTTPPRSPLRSNRSRRVILSLSAKGFSSPNPFVSISPSTDHLPVRTLRCELVRPIRHLVPHRIRPSRFRIPLRQVYSPLLLE